MKKMNILFALLLSVFSAGCIETALVYNLNPDNSCKIDFHITVTLPTERFQVVEDVDLASYKAMYESSAKNKIKTKMLPNKDIDAWSNISWWVSDDRKIHAKGSAYVKDIGGAAIEQNTLGKMTWKKGDNGETILEMAFDSNTSATKPASEMSKEQLDNAIKRTRKMWEEKKDTISKSIGLSKAFTTIILPGKVTQVSGFAKNADGSVSFDMDGKKYVDYIEKVLADDKALEEMLKSGKSVFDPIVMLENMNDSFKAGKPFRIVMTGDIKPLFDYKAEVEKAKAAMPELLRKIDLEEDSVQVVASQPTPQQLASQAEYKKKVEDLKKEFPFVPISDWKGMKFVFVKREKDFQKSGYHAFKGGKGENGLVTYDEAAGRIGTVIDTLVTKDHDISYDGREAGYIALKMDDNGQIYIGKTSLPGCINDIVSIADVEKAKTLFKGKTIWYKLGILDIYPPGKMLNNLFTSISVSMFSPLKIVDIEAGNFDIAPVRFIMETASGKKVYRDCLLSGTNDYQGNDLERRCDFYQLFYLDDLRKIYPWGDKVWIAIERGRFLPGMTTEQVSFHIDKPDEIIKQPTGKGSVEQWRYGVKNEYSKEIKVLTFENGVLTKIDKQQKTAEEMKVSEKRDLLKLDISTTKPAPRPTASEDEIKKLAGQLGDKDSKVREEARRKLIEIGAPALSIVGKDDIGSKDILLLAVLKDISQRYSRLGLGNPSNVGGNLLGTGGEAPKKGFYGIESSAKQVIYVLDRDGSMVNTFSYLRLELLLSIGRLKETQDFHVIFFSNDKPIENSPKQLVEASKQNKVFFADFLKGVEATGQTDPMPALKRAFELLKDSKKSDKVIYLLMAGEFPDKKEAMKLIKEQNPEGENQIIINTILFCDNSKEAEAALQKIAKENKGQYKFVDPED